MSLFLDSSALVKRYVAEPESAEVRSAMQADRDWIVCRIAYVETVRAVGLAAGIDATQAVIGEWPAFTVVEVDQQLADQAAQLALQDGLRSLDSLHLAAALLFAGPGLRFVTWDRRLHSAAQARGLTMLPAAA